LPRSTGQLIVFDVIQYLVGKIVVSSVMWLPLVEAEGLKMQQKIIEQAGQLT
jgi:hypothetical protein